MARKKIFEKEHWYVTNIDHLSLKAELGNGLVSISIIHDKTNHSFYLPNSRTEIINNKKDLDKKIKIYFDVFLNCDEMTFMRQKTNENNYADYINLFTDLHSIKNKLGLTIWRRKKPI